MVEIKKNIVETYTSGNHLYAKGKYRTSWVGMVGNNSATEIAIHQTGNTGKGANAEMHAKLQKNGNTRIAGWHYTVDDKEAVQSFPHSARVYHTGSTHGHKNAIGVEICINSDGDYKKAIKNAVDLVKKIMKDEGISIDKVKRHYDYSGKICPAQIMDKVEGISWTDFKGMLNSDSSSKPVPSKPSSNKPSSNKPSKKSDATIVQEVIAGKWGTGGDRQNKLNDAGYDADKIQDMVNAELQPKKPSIPQIKVDGSFGANTTRRLQQVLGTPVDGVISNQYKNRVTSNIYSVRFGRGGSTMVRKMQRRLGVSADGYIGEITTKSLQRRLGTPVTGGISKTNSTVVKALQRRLNDNRF